MSETALNPTPEKDWREVFLEELARTSNVSKSAKKADIDRSTAYIYRRDEKQFAELWEEAIEIATDALEDEARRRALEGTLKPVFHQGIQCGEIPEYSDTLMIFLLKAHRPLKFRDNIKHDFSGNLDVTSGGKPIEPASPEAVFERYAESFQRMFAERSGPVLPLSNGTPQPIHSANGNGKPH